MDPTIIVALIGGAVAIVSTGATLYVTHIRHRKDPVHDPGRDSKRFSYTIERFRQVITIVNDSGDCKLEREYHGVRVNPGVTLHEIPGWIDSDERGEVAKLPQRTWVSDTVSTAVQVKATRPVPHRAQFTIEIAGGLAEGDPPLDVGIAAELTRAHLIQKHEVDSAYRRSKFKSEYTGILVDLPIETLELEVRYPEAWKLEIFATVFRAHTEDVVHNEKQRISNGLDKSQPGIAQIAIEKPLLSHTYVLFWAGV